MARRTAAVALAAAVWFSGCLFVGGRQPTAIIRIAVRKPSSIDPAKLRDSAGILIARQVFDPLVDFDPLTSSVRPGSATWQIHDGGTRFVFRLKSGARFHNGREVTSEDVRFSLNRLARKDTGSEAAFLLDSVAGFDRVNVTGEALELEGVTTPDARTVEIRTSTAWMDFPYVLTHPSTAPIPRSEFESDPAAFQRQPIGSGAYALTGPIEVGKNILLVSKSEQARGIQRVQFVIYEDPEDEWRDFEEGRLDIAEAPPGKIGLARAKYGEEGFSSVAAGIYLGFNLRNPKFADVRLRRAISLTIDRVQIARSIYGDALVAAKSLIPEGIRGGSGGACGQDCEMDLARAESLVAEIFPQGGAPSVAYDYPAGAPNEAVARSIRSGLADVGLNLEPRVREADVTAFFDLIASGGQELFFLPWPAEYPLADWFLNPLFRSGSPDNHTGYSVPEVDELLVRARSAPQRSERLELYSRIERRVLADMPVIPIGFFRSRFAATAEVEGFYTDRLGSFEIARFGS